MDELKRTLKELKALLHNLRMKVGALNSIQHVSETVVVKLNSESQKE